MAGRLRARPKWHLVTVADTQAVTAACGLKGIPELNDSFNPKGDTFSGIVPASVGRAFKGKAEIDFHHMSTPGGMCGTCYRKWQDGADTHVVNAMDRAGFTPATLGAAIDEAAAERGLTGHDAELFAAEAYGEYEDA